MTFISFSEAGYGLGTVNPTYVFSDNTVRFQGVIVSDGAQPATPVIAANTSYLGPVTFQFDVPATTLTFDAGYFNQLGSTTFRFYDANGQLLGQSLSSQLGVQHVSFSSASGVSSVAVVDTSFDDAGFSVDSVNFTTRDLPNLTIAVTSSPITFPFAAGALFPGSSVLGSDTLSEAAPTDSFMVVVDRPGTIRFTATAPGSLDNASVTVSLAAGTHYVNIGEIGTLTGAVSYTVYSEYISETPATSAQAADEWIDDTIAEILSGVFGFQDEKFSALADIMKHLDSAQAAAVAGKIAKGYQALGIAIDVANFVDNVAHAANPARAAFIEVVSYATAFGLSYGAGYVGGAGGAVFGPVGAILAASGAKIGTSIIWSTYIDDWYAEQVGAFYDSFIGGPQSVIAALADLDPARVVAFDPDYYLATYADARAAVAGGAFPSALAHYLAQGIGLGYHPNATQIVAAGEVALNLDTARLGAAFNSAIYSVAPRSLAGDGLNASEEALATAINTDRTDGTEFRVDATLSAIAHRKAVDLVQNLPLDVATQVLIQSSSGWAEPWSNGKSLRAAFQSSFDQIIGAGAASGATRLLVGYSGDGSLDTAIASLRSDSGALSAMLGLSYDTIGVAEYGGVWVMLLADRQSSYTPVAPGADGLNSLTLYGDDAPEMLGAGTRSAQVSGGAGRDTIAGGTAADHLDGDGGDDSIDGGGGNDSIRGGAGADRLLGDGALANNHGPTIVLGTGVADLADVIAVPAAIATGQQAVRMSAGFSLAANANIESATTRPHLTASRSTGGIHYYAIEAWAGENIRFDIDGGDEFDAYIRLFNASGTLLTTADDSTLTQGGAGSTSTLDSYLSYTFSTAGTYYLAVGDYPGTDSIPAGATYDLHLSIDPVLEAAAPGNDWIEGGDGADTIDGGGGFDTVDFGGDAAAGGPAGIYVDLLNGFAQDGFGNYDVLIALESAIGSDQLRIGTLSDVMLGDDGANFLDGRGGLDYIVAGGGNDTVQTGSGDPGIVGDIVVAGAGDDRVIGGTGATFVYGNGGSDSIEGGDGSDWLFGGDFTGSVTGIDTLVGGNGNDVLAVGSAGGSASMVGGSGNDTLYGGSGSGGNDTIVGGTGSDFMYGADGNDTYRFDATDVVGGDFDQLLGFNAADTLSFASSLSGQISGQQITLNDVSGSLLSHANGWAVWLPYTTWTSVQSQIAYV